VEGAELAVGSAAAAGVGAAFFAFFPFLGFSMKSLEPVLEAPELAVELSPETALESPEAVLESEEGDEGAAPP